VPTSRYLPIYLNDHLAGATVGTQLARRTAGSNRDHPSGPVLRELATEIAEDRQALEDVMQRLGVARDRLKSAVAWVGEKAGRLKLNGELLRYSPLSRLVELEGLALGVTGKLALWRALERVRAAEPRLAEVDLAALIARAESQRTRIEALRLAAVDEALLANVGATATG
jgi:hypothetical protein